MNWSGYIWPKIRSSEVGQRWTRRIVTRQRLPILCCCAMGSSKSKPTPNLTSVIPAPEESKSNEPSSSGEETTMSPKMQKKIMWVFTKYDRDCSDALDVNEVRWCGILLRVFSLFFFFVFILPDICCCVSSTDIGVDDRNTIGDGRSTGQRSKIYL